MNSSASNSEGPDGTQPAAAQDANSQRPATPEEPTTSRIGPGWVERSDGYLWIDSGSGAGHLVRGYWDDQANCPRFT